MLVRYSKSDSGRVEKQAEIYTYNEHGIGRDSIDPDALWVTKKLRESGYDAYIVGGAVRDLLLGNTPKDFDIATDANPRKIRKIFRQSRVIGRRFRLVHVYFPNQKYLEVSTFRSQDSSDGKNIYGSIEEDVQRRDFTINALFYCPKNQHIIDHVGGFKDIKNKILKPVIPLHVIFKEDPVRIIRGLKYASTSDFKLPFFLKRRIKKEASFIRECSTSRLTEELYKILQSGKSLSIITALQDYGALQEMTPEIVFLLKQDKSLQEDFIKSLKALDDAVAEVGEERRGRLLYYYIRDCLDTDNLAQYPTKERFTEGVKEVKRILHPLVMANKEIEMALKFIFKKYRWPQIKPKKRTRSSTGSRD